MNGNTPLDLVHAAQDQNGSSSLRQDMAEGLTQCLRILTQNKALQRLRKGVPMEVDRDTIRFASSASQIGVYEVKSASLRAAVDRLCSELLYNDIDAEALVFSFKDSSSCDVILSHIASNYSEISLRATSMPSDLIEDDVNGINITLVQDDSGDDCDDDLCSTHSSNNRGGADVTNESFLARKGRREARFTEARENSPGGLLLLLRMWFDLNPKSIGNVHVPLAV
jgi:hypothetical protein